MRKIKPFEFTLKFIVKNIEKEPYTDDDGEPTEHLFRYTFDIYQGKWLYKDNVSHGARNLKQLREQIMEYDF